jgi:hypothetical protein
MPLKVCDLSESIHDGFLSHVLFFGRCWIKTVVALPLGVNSGYSDFQYRTVVQYVLRVPVGLQALLEESDIYRSQSQCDDTTLIHWKLVGTNSIRVCQLYYGSGVPVYSNYKDKDATIYSYDMPDMR